MSEPPPDAPAPASGALARDQHRAYIKRVSSDVDSFEFAVSEHLRMSGVYWGACALHLLDALGDLDRDLVVNFVLSCRHDCGGFSGNVGHDPHILYTLSAVQILALFDALDQLDVPSVMRYVAGLQLPSGAFTGDEWGETDTRFVYFPRSFRTRAPPMSPPCEPTQRRVASLHHVMPSQVLRPVLRVDRRRARRARRAMLCYALLC